jgi:acetoin utilization deacetylase AcuC-like enzyme
MKIGLVTSSRFADHYTGENHPECADRLRAIYRVLHLAKLLPFEDPFPDFLFDPGEVQALNNPLIPIDFQPAEAKWIQYAHPDPYMEDLIANCNGRITIDEGETQLVPESIDHAILAAGAALAGCDAVMSKAVLRAFVAIRPPGHHAEPDRAMGFCLLNNVAIAARYLQYKHGLSKISIVDFDVHHGNGTQKIFYDDPSVLYISLHQEPRSSYPGTGFRWEIGKDEGKGHTINLPLPRETGDEKYLSIVRSRVIPAIEEFAPGAILLSAGFDAHADDKESDLKLTENAYETLARMICESADRICEGRVISLLEGGYNLKSLSRSVLRHLKGLGAE